MLPSAETNYTLKIPGSKSFPEVQFLPDGTLSLMGNLMNDRVGKFFLPLLDWAENTRCPNIFFTIRLDYLNSNGAAFMVNLLQTFEKNERIRKIEVLWIYDEDDDAHYELGEFIQSKLSRTAFIFNKMICLDSEKMEDD